MITQATIEYAFQASHPKQITPHPLTHPPTHPPGHPPTNPHTHPPGHTSHTHFYKLLTYRTTHFCYVSLYIYLAYSFACNF